MSLTIVIPTLRKSTLQRAVDSVKNQTVPTKRIVQYDKDKQGAALTRNKAIKKVKTKWVGFCDDDDELDEHYHEWLKEYMEYSFDVVIFRMKNQPNGGIPLIGSVGNLVYNDVGISFALKTKIAKKFPFNDMLSEDYDLLLRLEDAGYKLVIDPRIAYYIHGKHGTD